MRSRRLSFPSFFGVFLAPVFAAAAGFPSLSNFIPFDLGGTGGIVSDNAGNSYIGLNPQDTHSVSVVSLAADGSVRFRKTLPPTVTINGSTPDAGHILRMAAAPNGFVVAREVGLAKYDSQGAEIFANALSGLSAVASDAAGNTYGAFGTVGGMTIYKLDTLGRKIATFQVAADAIPASLSVDSSGAVYVAGHTVSVARTHFPTTPGAFAESNPADPLNGGEHGFAMKVSPALDRVVYATLLTGWQPGYMEDHATSIAADGSGAAYVGGVVSNRSDYSGQLTSALKEIGFPLRPTPVVGNDSADDGSRIGYVVKLNASGSVLLYAAALCSPCAVEGIALSADGAIQAIASVNTIVQKAAMLFAISPSGDRLQRAQTFNGAGPLDDRFSRPLDVAFGASGSVRVVAYLTSTSFPWTYNEHLAPYPALLEVPPNPAPSDVEVTATFPEQIYQNGAKFRITVYNHGPADAEMVEVHFPFWRFLADHISCTQSGPISTYFQALTTGWVTIPKIAAGDALSIECSRLILYPTQNQFTIPIEVSSLSSDVTLGNNYFELTGSAGSGKPGVPFNIGAPFIAPNLSLIFYCQPRCLGVAYQPEVTVTVPDPQRWRGNLWFFDSWDDGIQANPRTFITGGPEAHLFSARPGQACGVDPPSLDFVAAPGVSPHALSVTLYPLVSRVRGWSFGKSDVPWLTTVSLQPRFDSELKMDVATLTATSDTAGLSPGYYTTTFPVTLTSDFDGTASTVNIRVSLRVMDKLPVISAVLDAATYRAAVSPTQVITIFGTGLAPPQLDVLPIPAAGDAVYTFGGTSVLINDQRAQLVSVQEGQVSAIVPYTISLGPQAGKVLPLKVRVDFGGAISASYDTTWVDFAPGVFTLDSSGRGPAAAIDADGSVNSPQHPAVRGSVLTLFATGFFGNSSNSGGYLSCPFGFLSPYALQPIDSPVEATVGGKFAYVFYAGAVAGLVCGVQQINVVIPDDSPAGDAVPIQLRMLGGGGSSLPIWYLAQDGTTIAVH